MEGNSPTGIVVDLNPDNGRSDIRTKFASNWTIKPGLSSEFSSEQLQARIVSANDGVGELNWGWWKAGYDSGATLCSDGVVPQRPGDGIVLSIDGLKAGKHSLTTWHNQWTDTVDARAIAVSLRIGSAVIHNPTGYFLASSQTRRPSGECTLRI